MSNSNSIAISVARRRDPAVVAVSGVVDLATAPALQEAIDGLLSDTLTPLIIDLSEVTFLASAGLAILASTCERLDDAATFAVVAGGPAVTRPIRLTLDQLFPLYSTLDAALANAFSLSVPTPAPPSRRLADEMGG